ncbi:MAG: GNAT family N-acetyltransferase, partial [Rickettsiaceae bacterium]|nr:GNAT family N-acetyltransferase [Rickettsiaceae bacterium]
IAVSDVSGKVIGFVAWSKTDLVVSDAVRFHIEGLVIDKNYRSIGIGRKLMEFVESLARKKSPAIIDLTSGLRREKDGSHEFYKKLGYKNEGKMAKLYLRKEV